MKFKILSDSSCDLDNKTIEELGIDIINLKNIDENNDELPDDFSNQDLYREMREGKFFKTSQITAYDYQLKLEEIAKEGKDIIVLTLSSGLSGTYQNAYMAAREVSEKYKDIKIEVIDSLAASVGFGLITYYTALAAKKGMDFEKTVEFAKYLVENTEHIFTVFDLKYLYQGGRVSKTKAKISSVLNIIPILEVDDEGKLYVSEVIRGKNKAFKKMIEIVTEKSSATGRDLIFPVHGDEDKILDLFIERLEEKGFTNHKSFEIGRTIACHVGPDMCGVGYLKEDIKEEFRKYIVWLGLLGGLFLWANISLLYWGCHYWLLRAVPFH